MIGNSFNLDFGFEKNLLNLVNLFGEESAGK